MAIPSSAVGAGVGRAPGKLILCGEHAVVYGHAAIAGTVSLGTVVTAVARPGPSGITESSIHDERLWPALAGVVPPEGVGVSITSTLPIGCGMGSSAALAVATVRAIADLAGEPLTFAIEHARGFSVERAFHGNPSGIDHAVCALGGLVRYRRTPEGPVLDRLEGLPPLRLVVVNTGKPGNTAEMVAGVRERGCEATLARIGALVGDVEVALRAGDLPAVGHLLDENHRLLDAIGVSTPALDAACADLRAAGCLGAKLAGAGGGGVAFGLLSRPAEPVVQALRAKGWDARALDLGA